MSGRRHPAWRRLGPTLFLAGLLGLALGGCATGSYSMVATIAGGERIQVPLARGGAAMTNEGGVRIDTATSTQSPDKKFVYLFAFTDSRKRALRHVRVEDVSDEKVMVLVDRADPTLSASGQWKNDSETLEPTDPRLAWIATLSDSLRVVRFILTFADGQTQTLYQGTFYPAPLKASIRHAFGQNY